MQLTSILERNNLVAQEHFLKAGNDYEIARKIALPNSNIHTIVVADFSSGSQKTLFRWEGTGVEPRLHAIDPDLDPPVRAQKSARFEAMPFDCDFVRPINSMTKSFTALAFFKAVGDYKRLSITDDIPLSRFYPELGKSCPLRVGHVLNMAKSFDWDEHKADYRSPENPMRQLLQSTDPVGLVLERIAQWQTRPDARVDEVSVYNGGCTTLLMDMTEQLINDRVGQRSITLNSGKTLADFAEEALFQPLGIRAKWASFTASRRVSGSGGLEMSPNDLLKVAGYLFSERPDLLRRLLDNKIPSIRPGRFYSGQFWISQLATSDGSTVDMISMSGVGGQRLSLIPSLKVAIGMTGGNYNQTGLDNCLPDSPIVGGYLLPAVGINLVTFQGVELT